jgi:hypothetical protein
MAHSKAAQTDEIDCFSLSWPTCEYNPIIEWSQSEIFQKGFGF